MQRQQKLLLSFMVGVLVLFYRTAMAAALSTQEIADIAKDSPVESKPALTSRKIAEIALGSTVHLATINTKGGSTGSGFFVGSNQIATNYHVIKAILNEGALGGVKLVGKDEIYAIEDIVSFDKEKDLAIIKVTAVKGTGIDVPALPLGNSDVVQIGEKIYVAGNPQGLEGTFSDGIISAIRPEGVPPLVRGKILQMTAPVSPGSSGGPVLNESGEVIGISVLGSISGDAQNLNFAIPVNYLKRLANIPTPPTPVKPKAEPPPVKSKPVKPKGTPSPVEPQPVKPKVKSSPAEPKPVKPQVNSSPVESKQVKSQADSPKQELPKPPPRHDMLDNGIKLYEQARYNQAIEALNSAVRELEDSKQRALAHLYLGASKRGSGESNDKVKKQFQEAIRHNPDQKLPARIGEDHPIFAELLEEVRKELTGKLTVLSLLPHTEIWIDGKGINKKMLGTGIVSSRLLEGAYIVEGIYAGGFKRRAVTIEPNQHKELDLEIPPIVKPDSPSRISVGEIIPLAFSLISTKAPQQVEVYYKIYNKHSKELAQHSQKMRLWEKQSPSSTWIYKAGLPSQKHVGSIEYYIEVVYENRLLFRHPAPQYPHYQISIFDDKSPTIDLLNPPESAQFTVNQQTTLKAEVIDNGVVEEVRIYFLAPSDQSQKLFKEGSSDMYTRDITLSLAGSIEYYLTATDEAGNKSQSELRHIDIRLEADSPESEEDLPELEEDSPEIVEPPEKRVAPIEPDISDEPDTPEEPSEETPRPPPKPPATSRIWVNYTWLGGFSDVPSTSDLIKNSMFRLTYLREGKPHSTLGAQLDFYPDRTNVSATALWGPALGTSNIAFTLRGGIAAYKDTSTTNPGEESLHITPLLGAGLKVQPMDKIALDVTGAIQSRQGISLYNYEAGIRFYITRELSLRAGYGKLYLGDVNVTILQIGLGCTF